MDIQTLHGSCACGRNRYVVEIPSQETHLGEVRYDNSNPTRHHSASPITLWLRVPLEWYTSATFAQFPDETPFTIQRTFTSPYPSSANARRQFCGYCGTVLTQWHERTHEDADYINLTVGSLLDEDQEQLEELGWLPSDSSDDEPQTGSRGTQVQRFSQPPASRGAPWFEELIEKSRLGRIKRQRGGQTSRDGNVRVEWEVVEWTGGDDDEAASPPKRKIGEVEADEAELASA